MQLKNMVAMGLRVVSYQILGRRCPVNVMLAVTNRCNCSCNYCDITSRNQKDIPLDDILRLIDEIKAAGAVRLGLWGGEPLLRDDIGEIVSYAKSKKLYVTMDTNGLIWPQCADKLKDLDHVVFALDGDRSSHEANRGEGTFDRVMEALENATSNTEMNVWTLSVLTKNNLNKIDYILDTAEKFKTYAAFQILHHNDVLGRNHDEMMPTNEEYKKVIRHLLKRKKEGARISSSARYLNYLLKWKDYQQTVSVEPHLGLSCKAGGLYCNVDADGKVYGCSLLVEKAEALNAFEVGFRKAFDAIPAVPCQGCTAACFTEYNYLYGLDPKCILEWINTTRA